MQKYTKIPTSQTLQSSLPLILDNDLTVMSQNSGTAFPTSNLVVGMSCLRTDQDKIYTLKSINSEGVTTWVETSNLNAKVWTDLNHGPNSGLNADMVDGIQAAKVATANQLLALDANKKLPASITGDAATVAGYKPGLTSGALAINSGARNVNLNADMVDGYHAGNVAGAVAVKTSTHWSQRDTCPKCPVLQLCKGSCMFLEGDLYYAGCNASYSDNVPFLAAAIEFLTGQIPFYIEGDLHESRKDIFGQLTRPQEAPKPKRVIPIKVADWSHE